MEEHFDELTGGGKNIEIDARVADGDNILHNICTFPDICKYVLSDGIAVNSESVSAFLGAQMERVQILFSCFGELFLKINSNIFLIL